MLPENLLSAMLFLKPPTIFFSLSCADFHWRDLHQLMPYTNYTRFEDLKFNDRVKMINTNPHITAWHFEQRTP